MVSPLVSSAVIQYVGWRYIYLICMGAALIRFINICLVRRIPGKERSFDAGGALFLVLALVSICLLFTAIAQYAWEFVGLLAAIITITSIAFVYYEKDEEEPIIDYKILVAPIPILLIIQSF